MADAMDVEPIIISQTTAITEYNHYLPHIYNLITRHYPGENAYLVCVSAMDFIGVSYADPKVWPRIYYHLKGVDPLPTGILTDRELELLEPEKIPTGYPHSSRYIEQLRALIPIQDRSGTMLMMKPFYRFSATIRTKD